MIFNAEKDSWATCKNMKINFYFFLQAKNKIFPLSSWLLRNGSMEFKGIFYPELLIGI